MIKTSVLKNVRERMHLTQQSFAALLNVTRVSVANYETFKRRPQIEIAYRILDIAASHGIPLKLEDIYSRQKQTVTKNS